MPAITAADLRSAGPPVSAGGRAIGVLGTGIDACYPKANKRLYEEVLERGTILSELPTGSHPVPENFPLRNRIISGMPLGVVIGEGKQHRGSLSTARQAREFGREVFGVPGNVTQEASFAPNQLSKQRAKLVTSAKDVIEALPKPVRATLVHAEEIESEQRILLAADGLNQRETKIYELLSAEKPRHIDDLVETTGLNSSEVLATLFDLEMKGIIRQLPGKQFTKVQLKEGKTYRRRRRMHRNEAGAHQGTVR
jgi:DNA processing protein